MNYFLVEDDWIRSLGAGDGKDDSAEPDFILMLVLTSQ